MGGKSQNYSESVEKHGLFQHLILLTHLRDSFFCGKVAFTLLMNIKSTGKMGLSNWAHLTISSDFF